MSDGFVWYFQKFKWSRGNTDTNVEISPVFGSQSNKATIYGGLTQPIDKADSSSERRDIYETNMGVSINASSHIKYANLRTFLTNLASAGFGEATEALVQEISGNPEL